MLSSGLYWLYESGHAALQPARALADVTRLYFKNPLNPLAHTMFGKSMAATAELFERSTRRYGKPEWRLDSVMVGGERAPIHVSTPWERPFCRLLHFERMFCHMPRRPQPKMLIVAPMSGHYATLLRGTVERMLPFADVYITDWADAKLVPVAAVPRRAFQGWRYLKPGDAPPDVPEHRAADTPLPPGLARERPLR